MNDVSYRTVPYYCKKTKKRKKEFILLQILVERLHDIRSEQLRSGTIQYYVDGMVRKRILSQIRSFYVFQCDPKVLRASITIQRIFHSRRISTIGKDNTFLWFVIRTGTYILYKEK